MALSVAAALCLAAGGDTVLLLRSADPARDAFEERVAAELYASGFEVRSIAATVESSGDIPGQLWKRCQSEGARGVLWIAPRGDGQIDAWVAEAESAKAVVRTWAAPQTYAERATLALKAVELLHATLLETGVIEPDDPDLPSTHVRFRKRFVPHWTFGTALGVIVTPGGLRPQPLLELQLGYSFRSSLALDVQLATSVWPVRDIEPSGDAADIGIAFLRVLGEWTPLRAGPFAFGLVAGTGVLLLWMSGATSPDPTEPPSAIVRVGWLFSGGVSVSVELIDRVRLQLIATVGATAPLLVAEVAQVPVASVGQPLFDTLLRLDFD